MRFARERGDAQSRAKAVIGTRPNHPSASRRDRVSAYRACRARSVSPGQRPGSGPPETPRLCRGRSPRSSETVAHMLRNTNRAGGVDGARIGERPLQSRTVDGAVTQGFALGLEKRPYRPRADGDRFGGVMGWSGLGQKTGSGSRWFGWVGESGVRVRLGAMTTSGRERVALLWLFLPLGVIRVPSE
jgi:hypothetical protein